MKNLNENMKPDKSPINSIPPSEELNLEEFAKRMTKGMIASINREIEADEKFDKEHGIKRIDLPYLKPPKS